MEELAKLIEASGLTTRAFGRAISVRHARIVRMLKGFVPVPEGILDDGFDLVEQDIPYAQGEMMLRPELRRIHPAVYNYCELLKNDPQAACDLDYLQAYFESNKDAANISCEVWKKFLDYKE